MKVNVPLDIKPGELRCPRCFHRDIVPSMPRGLRDQFMGLCGRSPRHCRSCGKRFYVLGGEADGPASASPPTAA